MLACVKENMIDLFDIENRDNDSGDISNCILHLMYTASIVNGKEYNGDLVDADTANIEGIT